MHTGLATVVLALLITWIPAQTRHASRMALETHEDACMGLTAAECCAQSLELAGFRATGDQIPRAAKSPVKLSCGDSSKVVPEAACRSISMARGFSAKDVSVSCAPDTLEKRCHDEPLCRACVTDLAKLEFKSGYRACYAVTYKHAASSDDASVIILHDTKASAAGGGVEIRKRRTVVQ
jgi:hypothetical protein